MPLLLLALLLATICMIAAMAIFPFESALIAQVSEIGSQPWISTAALALTMSSLFAAYRFAERRMSPRRVAVQWLNQSILLLLFWLLPIALGALFGWSFFASFMISVGVFVNWLLTCTFLAIRKKSTAP
jgi:hypothetical protein